MKLLIDWYANDETRKFLRRQVIEKSHNPNEFLIAWMTEGAIWKNYTIRSVSKERFEEELRKQPK